MERNKQIDNLASILSQLGKNNPNSTPETLAQDLRAYACDCFEAWYMYRVKGVIVGKIQNDNGEGFYKKTLDCMEDAATVYPFGDVSFCMLVARLLTRWININNFAI